MDAYRNRPTNSTRSDTDHLVQRGLKSIYANQDGSLPDISHLDVRRRSRWWLLLAVVVLGGLSFASVAWLGYMVFSPSDATTTESLSFEITGEQNISSGDEITYTLEYRNADKVTLHNVEVIMRYPEGFSFVSAEPPSETTFNTTWKIGDLAENASGTIEIRGKLIGEVGSVKILNATASFQPENFSSTFKQSTSFSSHVTNSILSIALSGPEKVLPERKTSYTIRYRNTADQDLEQVRILVAYPENFIFEQAEPAPFSREDDARNLNNQWNIERLGPQQEGEIVITGGYLSGGDTREAEFGTQIGFVDQENQFEIQQQQSVKTTVVNANLDLRLVINGTPEDQPVNFGQLLTYTIAYKNLGVEELQNVQIILQIDSDVIDWDRLTDKNLGVREGATIIWNSEQLSELAVLRPQAEGEISLSVPIKELEDVDPENVKLQTVSSLSAIVQSIGPLTDVALQLVGNRIQSNINTDLELSVEGRYFNDDNIAVGTGPLPPVVGQTTTFRIYWAVANSLHAVTDAQMTAILPDGIEWNDKFLVGAGSVSYSLKERIVTWKIGEIPVNSTFEKFSAWFDVRVTPTKQQARKLLILTDQATFTGTDQETNAQITRSAKVVTSNLEDDPYGFGRGLVIEITE